MEEGIFLSIKDLQKLLGCKSYKTADKLHLAIRDALKKKSVRVSIKEYCEYDGLDFDYVWGILRAKKTPQK